MRISLFAAGVLTLTVLASPVTQGAPSAQPPRWVLADDVRVRVGPSAEQKVNGTLSRGAELILKTTTEMDGYCLIEGEGQYGYVACKYLSAERVARPRAGVEGVDAAQRWVSGNSVTLREASRPDAAVVGRLTLNAIVTLLREEVESGYCEVRTVSGQTGFTACRYLALTPVVLAHVRGYGRAGGVPSPDYNPERAFWLEPSWRALEEYAEYLKQRHPELSPQGPWPRDEALERMKTHLAAGLKGPRPQPYTDWMELKRKASQEMDLSGEARRLMTQRKKIPDDVSRRDWWMRNRASELQTAIGIWGALHDPISTDGGAERVIRLIRALEFPAVRPSLFRSEAEVASPRTTAEEASGRFGIVFRQLITPRPEPGAEGGSGAGLYDMLTRTQLLVRPVQRVQLFRDGRLRMESSLVKKTETLWRDVDEPMCEGWVPGFAFGDADAAIWRYFDGDGDPNAQAKLSRNPGASLFAFYTNSNMPRGPARRSEVPAEMDRDATGFLRGLYLHYDLDGDGAFDIAVWEGQGKGPGHLEASTITDDRWYRLVLVNIDGAWKVLGSDVFGYGCGC